MSNFDSAASAIGSARFILQSVGSDAVKPEIVRAIVLLMDEAYTSVMEMRTTITDQELELNRLRKDEDPDWIIQKKAEAYVAEKCAQESSKPYPVGSPEAKAAIAKVAADNQPKKKGRPRKNDD